MKTVDLGDKPEACRLILERFRQALSQRSDSMAVVVGSMNADYTVVTDRIPLPGETVVGGPMSILPGGKSSNQAVASAKMGVHTAIIGMLGDDENAEFLEGRLRQCGVDTQSIGRAQTSSGSTIITVDAHGENTIVVSPGANAYLDEQAVEACSAQIERARVMGLCLETPLPTVLKSAQIARQTGVEVVINLSPFNQQAATVLTSYADVLIVNELECADLLRCEQENEQSTQTITVDSDWHIIAERLQRLGFSKVCITLGGDGCVVVSHEEHNVEPIITHVAVPKAAVVDTTGCGDSFMGGVIAGRAVGMDLVSAACLGSIFGSYAAQGSGAQASYGTLEEVHSQYLS